MCASRRECHAARVGKPCGGRPHDRHVFTWAACPIRRVCHPRPAGSGFVRGVRRGTEWLTASARPLYSSFDSGGRSWASACSRRTGNTGANPGRPRRCDQAPRPAASSHCDAPRDREKARSRPSLGVRRPTRCQEHAGPRGRDGGHGRCGGRFVGHTPGTRPASPEVVPPRRFPRTRGRSSGFTACRASIAWTRQPAPARFNGLPGPCAGA